MALETVILSPEKTILTYRLAGLGQRMIAHFVDALVIIAALWIAAFAMSLPSIFIEGASSVTSFVMSIAALLFPFAYFIFFEGLWNGQTIGKKLAGIRVRMADGTPITFAASTGRNLLRAADFLPVIYGLGVVSMFVNPRFQRIGDIVAGTIVTNEDKVTTSFSVAPHRAGIHPLEHLVGELRNMTDDQYYVMRRYCDRFPDLLPEVQSSLTQEVWLPLAKNLEIEMQPSVHPIYLAEAAVMKYGRMRGLL